MVDRILHSYIEDIQILFIKKTIISKTDSFTSVFSTSGIR